LYGKRGNVGVECYELLVLFDVECRHYAKLPGYVCCVVDNKEVLTNVSRAKPSSQRRATDAEFIEHLKCLVQKFPNGLPLSKLAFEYEVIIICQSGNRVIWNVLVRFMLVLNIFAVFGKTSFRYVASAVWNRLPLDLLK